MIWFLSDTITERVIRDTPSGFKHLCHKVWMGVFYAVGLGCKYSPLAFVLWSKAQFEDIFT